MPRKGCIVAVALGAALLGAVAVFGWSWWGRTAVEADTAFLVPSGSTLTSVARKLEDEELIGSADSFLMQAKILGSGDPVKAVLNNSFGFGGTNASLVMRAV